MEIAPIGCWRWDPAMLEVEFPTQQSSFVGVPCGPRLISYWSGIQVHFVTPEYVVAARGYDILVKPHEEQEWRRAARVPGHPARKWTAAFPILRTVSRSGIRLIATYWREQSGSVLLTGVSIYWI